MASLWRGFILGLINGLVAGGVAYTLLWLLVEYQNSRPSDHIHTSVGIKWWGLPFIGGVAVSIASMVVHRFLVGRVKSVVCLWQYVAVVSVLFGYVFLIILEILNDRFGGYPPFVFWNWLSAGAGATALMALAFSVAFNLFYSVFINLVLAQYSRNEKLRLP